MGTIYESIDNLVLQCDDAIRQIGNMQSANVKKSAHLHKSSKANLLSLKKTELEKGDSYSGYMFKKSGSGSWKKRWCVLKGCVFGYYK